MRAKGRRRKVELASKARKARMRMTGLAPVRSKWG